MKEQKCWSNGSDCIGEATPYGFVETPTKKQFDFCDFHSKFFGEALKPFVEKDFTREQREENGERK